MTSALPLALPAARYLAHQAEIDAAVTGVLQGARFILGPQTAAFEQEFAAFLGAGDCVGVGNGTDALEIALRACGIGSGDAVATVSHTAVATVAAIERAGATPVLVDIDPVSFTMAPDYLQETITEYQALPNPAGRPRLKAVIPVHLYGHPADMPAIVKIARGHGLRVIEDCAQSHGARLLDRMTGTWGDLAAFSFYPTKNLGAFGDGGAVVTSDAVLAEKARLLREYGWRTRQVSSLPGLNSRLDEIQAALLRVLLPHLEAENVRRREVAARYDSRLAPTGFVKPVTRPEAVHVFHQYVVRTARRDQLRVLLEGEGIPTQVHYPVPVHLQPAYEGRLFMGRHRLPRSEAAAQEVLSLPMSPYMNASQIDSVCGCLNRWAAKRSDQL